MRPRIVELVILAEDIRAATLLRRYAERLVHRKSIRQVVSPKGVGAAEQFVRQQYPGQVQDTRRGLKRMALVVHLDADASTVESERQALDAALKRAGMERRNKAEIIALIVPKRNIETWIHGLAGAEVDEEYDFKRDREHRVAASDGPRDAMCAARMPSAAEALHALTRPNAPPPPDSMPSLAEAIPELRRLESS